MPTALMEMLTNDDAARAGRLMEAVLGTGKIEIPALEAAYEGR